METIHLQLIIHGKVQGIFFRKSTREEALRLGLFGTVANLNDGSVQVHVQGDVAQVEKLLQWCNTGPPKAVVSSLEKKSFPIEDFSDLTLLR
ncbi:MAG: acylphosphatase [Flavobacteriales bacterium]